MAEVAAAGALYGRRRRELPYNSALPPLFKESNHE
jgi:hypothetical protein